MENLEKRTQEVVFQTCLLLIKHFRNLIEFQNETNQIRLGYNSRIFEHMLHKEDSFVFLGESEKAAATTDRCRLEHAVPCSYMIDELDKLIKQKDYSDEELATALQKNWKVARITLEEAGYLDAKSGAGLKSKMPDGWDFMVGRPEERLEVAGIKLPPKQS